MTLTAQEIALALAFSVQFATIVWFLASMNAKVAHMLIAFDKLVADFEAHKKTDEEKLHAHELEILALKLSHHGDTD